MGKLVKNEQRQKSKVKSDWWTAK